MTIRARITVGMLASTVLLAAVGAITELQAATGGENLSQKLQVIQRFVIFHLIFYAGNAVAWMFWQSNANRKLRDLGIEGMRFTPASSVWWWFVPIANLAVPQQAVDELWKASDPAASTNAWKTVKTSPFLVFWWIGVIGSALLGQGTARSGDFESALGWEIARNSVAFVAGLLAIVLVRNIDRRILLKSSGEAPTTSAVTAPIGAVVVPAPRGRFTGRQRAFIGSAVGLVVVVGLVAAFMLGDDEAPVSAPIQGATPVARPTKSVAKEPLTGRVAFHSRVDGDAEIYVMNLNSGARATQLTNNNVQDFFPSWSPDGRRIAFTRILGTDPLSANTDLFIINADGSGEVALTTTPEQEFESVWSPDAKRILFTSAQDERVELYVMNSDGSDRKRLTNNDVLDDVPNWSPDGKKIVWASGNFGSVDIFTMNADGSGIRQLTEDLLDDASPSWSPDGKRIAFVRGDFENPGSRMLYVMDADGGNPVELITDVDVRGTAWSPRGTWIMYSSGDDLFVIGSDGLDQRMISTQSGTESAPVWRKD